MKRPHRRLSTILKSAGLTSFEKRVYIATSRIPAGQTRSYQWVACRAGRPGAYRVVGNILHKNPYMGLVPCHRVVRADGSIGGFARGAAIKRRMLAREGIHFGCNRKVDVRGKTLL